MPLVVIHRDEGIEIAPAQHQIGAHRAFDIEASGLQPFRGGHGDPVVVVAEQAVLAGMRIDSEQADARLLDIELPQAPHPLCAPRAPPAPA